MQNPFQISKSKNFHFESFIMLCFILISDLTFAQWSDDPLINNPICISRNHEFTPNIVNDGSGGAIILWQDGETSHDIYVQRIDASGLVLWTTGGVLVYDDSGGDDLDPVIASDGSGGAIIAWHDDHFTSTDFDIYAQRIDSYGTIHWAASGVIICNANSYQRHPSITSDLTGGAIISWEDNRNVTTDYDIYAQRIDASGSVKWTADGVAICTATNDQMTPKIVFDKRGGGIISWEDKRNGSNLDIYSQRINSDGITQWTTNGIAISTASNDQTDLNICADGTGGAIITWEDNRITSITSIYAQKINLSGSVRWATNGVIICDVDDAFHPDIVNDDDGGAIITWQDQRDTGDDIYAQRINSSGNVRWTLDGVVISSAASGQYYPKITKDGSGGAIITWQDHRSGSNYDIYAQRINAAGRIEWTVDGVAICTAIDSQLDPTIVHGLNGASIITWEDYRDISTYSHIYASRINKNGAFSFITVTSPNGGEHLKNGQSYTITWNDNITENVKISLVGANLYPNIIIDPATDSDGSFNWTVRALIAGSEYRIRIESVIGTNSDESNSSFKINR